MAADGAAVNEPAGPDGEQALASGTAQGEQDEADGPDLFYTPAPRALVDLRQAVAQYSFQRAAKRLRHARCVCRLAIALFVAPHSSSHILSSFLMFLQLTDDQCAEMDNVNRSSILNAGFRRGVPCWSRNAQKDLFPRNHTSVHIQSAGSQPCRGFVQSSCQFRKASPKNSAHNSVLPLARTPCNECHRLYFWI